MFCRKNFVVDSYEILGFDEDFRSAQPLNPRLTKEPPTRGGSFALDGQEARG